MAISPSMQTTVVEPRVQVVVGLLVNRDRNLFVQQRRSGTPCAGQWEFPGGKIEPGEDACSALVRELDEELGIQVQHARKLTTITHDYEHAGVELEVFAIDSYRGIAAGMEGQTFDWLDSETVRQLNVLEAVHVILDHPEVGRMVQLSKSDE